MARRAPPAPPRLLVVATVLLAAASLPRKVELSSAPGPHITDLNVLLPPRMKNPVHYRLQATGGCFSWSWDHHDILNVQPEFNISSKCSTSARLVSVSPYNGPKETAVYATDLHSGTTIRCKVFIDKISRIQIFHHANKIDLDELATLRIRAFDSEENVFSSLVGLEFLWKLAPKPLEGDSTNHLIHVPLVETPLSDCGGFCGDLDTQIELEHKGVGSDLYVVKGVAIGHEVVTAQLLEPQFEDVFDSLILTVAEAMSLDPPSPVFVTIGALVRYTLRVIRGKTTQVIAVPSPHHKWLVMNSSVAWIDGMMGEAHALSLGKTDIVVEDTRVSGHAQTSTMHVVIPNKLCLYLTPVHNDSFHFVEVKRIPSSDVWYVFPGQEYIVDIKVFSEGADKNQIFVTEKNEIKLESDSLEYWTLEYLPKDGAVYYNWQSTRLLKPISQGIGTLTASLTYQRGISEIPEFLSIVQEVYVCSKVQILGEDEDDFFKVIRLPWAHGVHQEVNLRAIGGCGGQSQDYKWFSSDTAVVVVSSSGTLQAKRPGKASIKVLSVFDSLNYDEVLIEVSVPSTIMLLPIFPLEMVVGTQIEAAVTLKTSNGNYYSRCDAFTSSVSWKVITESGSFKFVNDTVHEWAVILPKTKESNLSYGCPCAWTSLYASAVGRAILEASLSLESASMQTLDGPTILRAASPIASYYPLTVCQANSGNRFGGYWVDLSIKNAGSHDLDCTGLDELYLVPGSAMDVSLLGGPERWDQVVDFIETFHLLAEEDLHLAPGRIQQHEYSNGQKLYQISCQSVGKFKLLFSRGNLVGNNHPSPIAEVYLSVICSFPSLLTLIANEPANRFDIINSAKLADRGPERLRVTPVTVLNGCTIRLAAVSIHATGRVFANSSSLNLKWELSRCEELAHWSEFDSIEQSDQPSWERYLVLLNASGLCTVRATVVGLSGAIASNIYDEVYSWLEGSETNLTDAITLQLVSSLKILPESILLLCDPEAKANLSVSGGTCFLDAYTNDTQVAKIIQLPESAECGHLTVNARGLGTSLVIVHDIGLAPPAVASALVKVATVDWINIMCEEEIYLLEGTTRNFDILAGIEDGTTFHPTQYMYMKIKVNVKDDILELVQKEHSSRDHAVGGQSISIRGLSCGITTIYVSVRQLLGYETSSQLVKVEVYRPLRLHPEYIFLVPGASYVLTVKDGPSLGSFVEYTSMHEGIAEVDNSLGKLVANTVGNSTVRAAVFGKGGAVICEASGQVEVGIPETMILEPQSNQLCVGCKMPISPIVPKGDLFSFYDVCQDYRWAVGDEKVLSFSTNVTSDSYSCEGKMSTCYFSNKANDHINVLIGRSAGKTEVSVEVSCSFVVSGYPRQVSYTASCSLEVVPDPPLSLGVPITWILPPFYTTSELLLRFTISHSQADSHNRKSISYSILRLCGRNDQLKDGIDIEGGRIITKESKDLACIQAKDQEIGRMDIACCVRIAEVSQVRITTAESSFRVVHLAVNSKLKLIVSYCDYLGYSFAEATGVVPVDVETNHPEVLSILMSKGENTTHNGIDHVILQGKKPGNALVRISINHNPKKSDFMLVSVGAQLNPIDAALYVGQYINFSVIGDGIDGLRSGKWSSGNSSILSIHANSGEGYAHREGTTQVIFEGSKEKLQTTVSVMKVNQIAIDAPKETLTNVAVPVEGYMFSVTFSGLASEMHKAIETQVEVPYDCRVEPPFIGYSKPWVNQVTGKAYCLFFPYSPEQLQRIISDSDVKFKENNMNEKVVFITVISSLKEPPNVIATARASFVGGFAVADKGKLTLTASANKSTIQVVGNTDIKMIWKAKDLLSVRPLNTVSSSVAGYSEYEVTALKNQEFKDKIVIALPANDQKVEIDVCYEPGDRNEPSKMSGISWLAVIICSLVLIITVVIFLSLLDRPDRSTPRKPLAPSPSVVSGSKTPNHMPADDVPSSPRTPSPFMEYLKQTIDQTPYYKRAGRRRFDPQYTY